LRKRCSGKFSSTDKAVAPAGNRLDISRFFSGLAERLAELVHRGVDVGVVIDVSVGRPKRPLELLAADDFALTVDED
jgi:hypothetical protein